MSATDVAAASGGPATAPVSEVRREVLFGRSNLTRLAIAFAALIAMVGISAYLSRRSQDALDEAARSQALTADIGRALELLEDAETGQRGFLLTEREAYLEPYQIAIVQIPGQLQRLVDETAGASTAQIARDLQAKGQQKLAEVTRTIELYRSGGRTAAIDEVMTDTGKRLMDGVRADAAALRLRQQAELEERLATARRIGSVTIAAQAGTAALVVFIAVLTGVSLTRNVATLRRAQSALAEANANLEEIVATRTAALQQANDEIQKFAYIVSHDLRAPLVNIMGFTKELEAAAGQIAEYIETRRQASDNDVPPEVIAAIGEDVPEAFEFVKTSTAKMDRLINAILKLSREGRRVLTPERLMMRPLLQQIAATLKHRADAVGAEIEINPVPNLSADRLAIEQIFGNLLDNAVKYLAPGRPGRIVVRGTARPPLAIFEIEDNGRGIAAPDRERVFDLFRRAGQQNVPGEGIGLAYVRQLVHRLGGTVEIESELGKGTIFRLSLPLAGSKS